MGGSCPTFVIPNVFKNHSGDPDGIRPLLQEQDLDKVKPTTDSRHIMELFHELGFWTVGLLGYIRLGHIWTVSSRVGPCQTN